MNIMERRKKYSMDKVFIFDVDGTLTPSRRKMTKDFEKFFSKWAEENTFYLVSGSDLEKMKEQVEFSEMMAGICIIGFIIILLIGFIVSLF